jgi:hypothetical protein
MFQLLKKKVEEIETLLKWVENHDNVMISLIESERHNTNPPRVFKVFSFADESLHFIISKEDETYDIPQIAGIETNGRYLRNDTLHRILLRLYNLVVKKYDSIMEVNKELEEAIKLFRENQND